MKIKTLVGAAVAVSAAMVMSVATYAATSYSIGTPLKGTAEIASDATIDANTTIKIPVYLESTEYDNVVAYDFDIQFDTSKFTYTNKQDVLTVYNEDTDENDNLGSISMDTSKSSDGIIGTAWFASENAVEISSEKIQLCNVLFKTTQAVSYSDIVNSFSIRPSEYVYEDESGSQQIMPAAKFASYVTFEVPKEMPESWTNGYIHALVADVNGKTADLVNYTETSTGYRFVLKINNTTGAKVTVPVVINAKVGPSETTADADLQTVEYLDLGTVTVENMTAIDG